MRFKLKFENTVCCLLFFTFLGTCFETFAFKKAFEIKIIPDSTVKEKDSLVDELKKFVPSLHEDMVLDRLACIQKDIKLTYSSDVLGWIKFYTIRERGYTERMLDKSRFYFPIFEEALKKHNLPLELKYLSIVESALIPKAASWAAAVGLWQFMPATGKEYGLHQDWFIDERMDIYKSTDAACRYLKFLYNYYKDWHLALAAYNSGPGRVNWAVSKAGGKGSDFWKIYAFLPRETRSYVPAFIATCYAMSYSNEHFIFAKNPLNFIPSDTILVSQFLNLEEFAKQIKVPKEQMEMLNPHLKKNAIPAYKKNYPLRFPSEKRKYLDSNRVAILKVASIASKREIAYTPGNQIEASNTKDRTKIIHQVKYGQSLSLIALQYSVTVPNIRIWNKMTSDMVYPNQKLDVWIKTVAQNQNPLISTVSNTQNTQTQTQTNPTTNRIIHLVQPGDTLWNISRKYKNVPIERIKKLNNITDKTILLPGQKLIIG